MLHAQPGSQGLDLLDREHLQASPRDLERRCCGREARRGFHIPAVQIAITEPRRKGGARSTAVDCFDSRGMHPDRRVSLRNKAAISCYGDQCSMNTAL